MSNSNYTVPAPKTRRRSSEQVAADRALVGVIRASLATNPAAVVRALEVLFARQTEDEQAVAATRHDNKRGFSQSDARTGSWLVETVIASARANGASERSILRGKALEMGQRIAGHYARTQLLSLAKAKLAAAQYDADLAAWEADEDFDADLDAAEADEAAHTEATFDERDMLCCVISDMEKELHGVRLHRDLTGWSTDALQREYDALAKRVEENLDVVEAVEATSYVDGNGDTRVPFYVTARLMAGPNPTDEEAEFWDSWKDEMKEGRA
jgi:hypothetical protein